MLLFPFTLLPICVLIFYFQHEKYNREFFLPVIFTGVFTGMLFLAYKLFFSSTYYLPVARFGLNFLHYFVHHALLPIVVLYGLFVLFTRKDSAADRASYFFPLTASFFSVYLPYLIFETEKPYSAFYVFVKPLLYTAILIFIHILLNKTANAKLNFSQKLLNIIVILFVTAIPAAIETMWICDFPLLVWLIPATLLCLLSAILVWPKSSIPD